MRARNWVGQNPAGNDTKMRIRIGRNAPCRCGSGKKFKDCCGRNPVPFSNLIDKATADPRIKETWSAMASAGNPQGHPVPSVMNKDFRFRFVGNRMYRRRPSETFHEFLFDLLRTTLGKSWYLDQLHAPAEKQHQILKWYKALGVHTQSVVGNPLHREGDQYGSPPTGDVQALIVLAHDVYHLLHSRELPGKLLKRLRDHKGFQGARYEIAVAATFVRAGFSIKFISEKHKKHCEFIARAPTTGVAIAVEAKSRHRPGALHQEGEVELESAMRGDVESLINDALEQNPGDQPFMIFVDLNAPGPPGVPVQDRPWFQDVWASLQSLPTPTAEHPDEFNAIFLTNFSYHWYGQETSGGGEYLHIISQIPKHAVPVELIGRMMASVQNYGFVPREI